MTLPVFPGAAVFRRELLSLMRSFRPYAAVAFIAGILAVVVYTDWPGEVLGEFTRDLRLAAELSRRMVHALLYGLFLCSIIVPIYAANSIVSERERGTYEFLRVTLIRPSAIVFAKLVNAVGFYFLLLVALLPVFASAFFLIGVDPAEVLLGLLIVSTTAISAAAAGIACSAGARRAYGAMAKTIVLILLFMLGPPAVIFVQLAFAAMLGDYRPVWSSLEWWFGVTCAPATYVYVLAQGRSSEFVAYNLGYQAAFTLFCLVLARRRVARPVKPPKIEQAKPIDDEEELRRRRVGFPFYLVDPLRRKPDIEDGRNPMMVREMRWGLMNRATTLIRVFYVALVVYFFIGILAWFASNVFTGVRSWMVSQIVLTAIAAPPLMSNALSKEYELGNMDMLRMTLLRPWQIISGKFVAGGLSLSPMLLAAAFSGIPMIIIGAAEWNVIIAGYTALILGALLCLSAGMFASMVTRRTGASLIASYGLVLVLFAGFDAAARAVWLGWTGSGGNEDARWFCLSPLLAFTESFPRGIFDQREINSRLWQSNAVITVALSMLLLAASVDLFHRYKLRDR